MVLEMSNQFTKSKGLNMLSFRGLLVFLGVRALLKYTIESDQNPRRFLEIQAGQPAGLNLHFNPPTVFPQGQFGNAHKAVVYPLDASRFCVLRRFWPAIRGREGPS